MPPVLLIGIAALVLLALSKNNGDSGDGGFTPIIQQAEDFLLSNLPSNVGQYAQEIQNAAKAYGVSPWVLAGIMYRESSGGSSLTPAGPGGTGDFYKRPAGRRYGSGYVVGPSGLPEDGQGWGRGLMQLDWAVQYPWPQNNPWWDPQTNINKAAEIVAANQRFFSSGPGGDVRVDSWRLNGLKDATGTKVIVPGWASTYGLQNTGPFPDPRPLSGSDLTDAVIASYNAGTSGVLQALAAGLPADAPTAGNNYASWIASRMANWMG